MPYLIQHIDAIARQKKRDVLTVMFKPVDGRDEDDFWQADWDALPIRKEVIQWLDDHSIGWQRCGEFANVNMMVSYMGQLYIDLPFDPTLPAYAELERFLENPDGSMRLPGVCFAYLPLEEAMKNAEQDEPGFWERSAENF